MSYILSSEEILNLFFNRKDVFGIQKDNGVYTLIKRNISLADIEKHIKGEITISAFCLNTNNKIKWACVDLDGDKNKNPYQNKKKYYVPALLIYNAFSQFPRMLEFSGNKGYHIWIFFNPLINAYIGQRIVKSRLNLLNIKGLEVFPKQTELNKYKKYGNAVKIPLGIHRKTKIRTEIIKQTGIKKLLHNTLYKNKNQN